MNATPALSTATAPADPLTDLVNQINEAHQEVRLALKRTGECAIKAGLLLLQAKKIVRHGSFAEWIAASCTFSERTAQLYMQLARRFPNPQNFADFSLTDLMEMLAPAKLPELKTEPAEKKQPRDKVAEAIKKGALAVLQKAWTETSEMERKLFLKQIRAVQQDGAAA
jgi:hypothetical protein